MKIGITGVTSLLGSHLAKTLVDNGYEVHGIARAKRPSIDTIIHNSLFKFFPGDVTKFEDLEHPLKDVEYVFHLASVSSERKATEEPLGCFKVNVLGTVNVLEMTRRAKIKKIIFSSSGAVYMNPDNAAETDPVPANGYYGFTKWTAENMINIYKKKFSVDFTILRFSRLYGPYMERNPVFDMAYGIIHNNSVKLYDSPGSIYDFLFIEDAVNALVMSMDHKWNNEIVNISSGKGLKISELLDIFKQISGKKDIPLEILKHNDQIDILSNKKALSLGWKPFTETKIGIEKTFKWFLESR
ncbi:MAG: NAD-dependent epimerase/dehydratase family protein [bacterium]